MYVDSNFIIIIYLARQAARLDIPLRIPLLHLQLIQRAHLFALERLLQPIRVLYKVLAMRLLPAAMHPVIKLERPVIVAVHLAGGHHAQEALLVVDHDDARLLLMGSGPAEGAALVGKPRHDWHGRAHEARVVDPITVVERAVEEEQGAKFLVCWILE